MVIPSLLEKHLEKAHNGSPHDVLVRGLPSLGGTSTDFNRSIPSSIENKAYVSFGGST